MKHVLPAIYWMILGLELVVLTALYVVIAPDSAHPLSIYLGWGAITSMVVMLVYSVARRSRALRQWMRLSAWLHFHIFLGIQGVLWAVFHALPMFARPQVMWLNPGVLNLLAVLVIFGSGIFGRYLYSWLPKTLGGEHMAIKDVDAEIAGFGTALPAEVSALWGDASSGGGFFSLVTADRQTRAALGKLRGMNLAPELQALAERRVWLERRRTALDKANRWFRAWIWLHRPIAAIMYVLSIVHVLLAYMFSPALR